MLKTKYKVIGVMSGTSLDGVDIIFVSFNFEDTWTFNIDKAETIPYSEYWVNTLKAITQKNKDELHQIDIAYTEYLAKIIKAFIVKHQLLDIDFVASHGHTALHQPKEKMTYQIGNLQLLADELNLKVICDFRVQDVVLGGQGAPLVPIGDKLLFGDYDYCLNLGGFANISFENEQQNRIAFDICPVNIVLNHYVSHLGLAYDNEGQVASKGEVNVSLLNQLNALEFYKLAAPKSLGLEWVEATIFPLIASYNLNVESILRTFVAHIAIQISKIIKQPNATVLVTGGGAYNRFLIEEIKAHSNSKIIIPKQKIIDYKEALIFALLGVLKDRNEVNCLSSVTGASKNHSSGKILFPKNNS